MTYFEDIKAFSSLGISDKNNLIQYINKNIKTIYPNASDIKIRSDIQNQIELQETYLQEQHCAIFNLKLKDISDPVLFSLQLKESVFLSDNLDLDSDLIFVLVSPVSETPYHLQALAKLSRILTTGDFADKLRGAETADAIISLFLGQEAELKAA